MNSCTLRRSLEQFTFRLPLRPFLADWKTVAPRFVAGLTGRLAGWVEVRAADCSVTDSAVIGDQSCGVRLFEGAASITLRPDELVLDFRGVSESAHNTVFETLRRTAGLMHDEFMQSPYEFCNLTCVQHAEVSVPGSADSYLAQFAYPETATVLAGMPNIRYEPSLRVVLSREGGEFQIQRVIEKSVSPPPEQLFVSTIVLFPRATVSSSDGPALMRYFQEASQAADQAIGLAWEAAP